MPDAQRSDGAGSVSSATPAGTSAAKAPSPPTRAAVSVPFMRSQFHVGAGRRLTFISIESMKVFLL